jgi:hypothetical protein
MTAKSLMINFTAFALGLSLHSLTAGYKDGSFNAVKKTAQKDTMEMIDAAQKLSNCSLNAAKNWVADL